MITEDEVLEIRLIAQTRADLYKDFMNNITLAESDQLKYARLWEVNQTVADNCSTILGENDED